MAKQLGRFKFERTFGDVVFYRLGDKWYVRMKSSLSGRRVKTGKKFVETMAYARRLGLGAALAGAVYEKLPESWKMFELYQKLTGVAARLLKEEKNVDDINNALEQQLYDWGYRKGINYPDIELKKKKIKLRTPRQCKKIEKEEELKQPESKNSIPVLPKKVKLIRRVILPSVTHFQPDTRPLPTHKGSLNTSSVRRALGAVSPERKQIRTIQPRAPVYEVIAKYLVAG
ncbi:MAG: hypothetical protein QM731_13325 [Chitinophagaceae bacterium]